MTETITGVNLDKIIEGAIFDGDELIIIRSKQRMMTIRQTDEEEITCFYYDISIRNNSVHNNGHGERTPNNPDYSGYKQKLMGAGLWH